MRTHICSIVDLDGARVEGIVIRPVDLYSSADQLWVLVNVGKLRPASAHNDSKYKDSNSNHRC